MRVRSNLGFLLLVVILLLPAACAMEALPAQVTIPQLTKAVTSTQYLTRTPTATNTWIPSNTPTIGPPPDMELKNITIYPEYRDYEHIGQNYSLLGRIRNNTDQIMVFHDRTVVFKFTFEVWEYDSWYDKKYRHVIFSKEAEQNPDYSRIMNCILYPGDEGVFMYGTYSTSKEYILTEKFSEHDGPLGLWFTYEGIYSTEPDLRLDYHPQTENLVFVIEKGELAFDYDVKVPNMESRGFSRLISYIILLDEGGGIINILKKDIVEMGEVHIGKSYHVHGTTATSINDREKYFRPQVTLTKEMIERVDHLEVLNEFEEDTTCRG